MKKPKVVHILANGQKVKSVEGHVIPAGNPVYEVIYEISKGARKSEKIG